MYVLKKDSGYARLVGNFTLVFDCLIDDPNLYLVERDDVAAMLSNVYGARLYAIPNWRLKP